MALARHAYGAAAHQAPPHLRRLAPPRHDGTRGRLITWAQWHERPRPLPPLSHAREDRRARPAAMQRAVRHPLRTVCHGAVSEAWLIVLVGEQNAHLRTRWTAASTVPPVARRSSRITTRAPSAIAPCCISCTSWRPARQRCGEDRAAAGGCVACGPPIRTPCWSSRHGRDLATCRPCASARTRTSSSQQASGPAGSPWSQDLASECLVARPPARAAWCCNTPTMASIVP